MQPPLLYLRHLHVICTVFKTPTYLVYNNLYRDSILFASDIPPHSLNEYNPSYNVIWFCRGLSSASPAIITTYPYSCVYIPLLLITITPLRLNPNAIIYKYVLVCVCIRMYKWHFYPYLCFCKNANRSLKYMEFPYHSYIKFIPTYIILIKEILNTKFEKSFSHK